MTHLKRHLVFSTSEILDVLKRSQKSESFRLHSLLFKLMLATNLIFFFFFQHCMGQIIFAGWTLGCTLILSAPEIRWMDLSLLLHRQWREKLQSILLSSVSEFIHLQMLASWWLWWPPRRGTSIQLLLETEKQLIGNDQVFLPASGHLG